MNNTDYVADMSRLAIIEQSGVIDEFAALDIELQRHNAREAYRLFAESVAAPDADAIEWWEGEYGYGAGYDDDESCDTGARDDFPSIIEVGPCCDSDYYDCECAYDDRADVDDYAIVYGRPLQLNRDDLVILALQWAAMDDSWPRNEAENIIRRELGNKGWRWFTGLARGAVDNWRGYLAYSAEHGQLTAAMEDMRHHVTYTAHYASLSELAALWGDAHRRMSAMSDQLETVADNRDRSKREALSYVASMVSALDVIDSVE